jgi:hypothetical protein
MKYYLSFFCLFASVTALYAQFAGFENKGLVGVGRISAGSFDKSGNGTNDTLGGFSSIVVDRSSLVFSEGKVSGILYGLPDRGFGDGTTDYHPRIQIYNFSITPYYGASPTTQDQILLTNTQTILLTYNNGIPFTGFDAGNTNNVTVPQAATNSLGGGRRAIDAEGLVRMTDGTWWISDEYGPALFHFDASGALLETILPPQALLPFQGNYPGKLTFTAVALPTSGRRNNRGLEGLSLTPDAKRFVAFLQSPTVQDEGGGNVGRNTRVLQFDASRQSSTYGQTVAEHIYQLTLSGSSDTNRHTLVSEVAAINSTAFLALERDSFGRGIGTNKPIYKKIVLFSTEGATNIAGSGYDLEKGAPGQLSLPAGALPSNLKPVARQDLVDLLDAAQLARFGLSATTNPEEDPNAISEKWEALGFVPLMDSQFPNDYLLLVGNDNDFKAPLVYHNGQIVGTNVTIVDIMLLAYRVTLPRTDVR